MSELRTARIVLLDRYQNVFIGQRKGDSKKRPWKPDLPGGRCDDGEAFVRAALRELSEELVGVDEKILADESIPEVHVDNDTDGQLKIQRWYGAVILSSLGEIAPNPASDELVGSAIVPAAVALHMFGSFPAHRVALINALSPGRFA